MLSLQPPPHTAPVLVLAIGNPSRGDDALGPETARRLAACPPPGVDVLTDFQLQVEHALDLLGRRLVVFVDASVTAVAPFELHRAAPARERAFTTHALAPTAVLHAYAELTGQEPPPAWVLAVRGESFELGAPLTTAAERHLDAALAALAPLLDAAADAAPTARGGLGQAASARRAA